MSWTMQILMISFYQKWQLIHEILISKSANKHFGNWSEPNLIFIDRSNCICICWRIFMANVCVLEHGSFFNYSQTQMNRSTDLMKSLFFKWIYILILRQSERNRIEKNTQLNLHKIIEFIQIQKHKACVRIKEYAMNQ